MQTKQMVRQMQKNKALPPQTRRFIERADLRDLCCAKAIEQLYRKYVTQDYIEGEHDKAKRREKRQKAGGNAAAKNAWRARPFNSGIQHRHGVLEGAEKPKGAV